MTQKFAYFIGGPLDGTRRVTPSDDRPPSEIFYLHAEPTPLYASNKDLGSPFLSSAQITTTRCVYRAFTGPVNPCHMGPPRAYYHGLDTEVMVYFYVGAEKL